MPALLGRGGAEDRAAPGKKAPAAWGAAEQVLRRDADDDFAFVEDGGEAALADVRAKRQIRAAKAVKDAAVEPAAAPAQTTPSDPLPPDDSVVEGEVIEDLDTAPVGVADDEPPM